MRVRPVAPAVALLMALTACAVTSPVANGKISELGLFEPGVPESYTPVADFSSVSGVRPNLDVYYSGWDEPFHAEFAADAARHGAVTLVQINPTGIYLAAIAARTYDTYLRGYPLAVHSSFRPVILRFGPQI